MSQQLLGATSPVTLFTVEEDALYYSTGMKWAHAKGGVMPDTKSQKVTHRSCQISYVPGNC